MEGDRFQRDQARFYGVDHVAKSTGSQFRANEAAFYDGEKPQGGFKIQATSGVTQTGAQVNTKSGIYRKDAAAFFGDDKFEVESQGTQFQQNAAAFLGTDMPASGERPFKLDKNA